MSPGCDVCGCWGGCPNGNMLNGWGAALCSIVADFVTSTTAGIDGWLGTTGFCHCSTSAAAVLHTLLRVLRWPALHWPPTAVELRSRRRWSCGRPGRRLVAVATIMGAAASHRQGGGTARPAAPPRKTRGAAVGCTWPQAGAILRGGCGRWVGCLRLPWWASRSAGFRCG